MITQEDIEEFFLNMIAELNDQNIPIMTHYHSDFRDYPFKENWN